MLTTLLEELSLIDLETNKTERLRADKIAKDITTIIEAFLPSFKDSVSDSMVDFKAINTTNATVSFKTDHSGGTPARGILIEGLDGDPVFMSFATSKRFKFAIAEWLYDESELKEIGLKILYEHQEKLAEKARALHEQQKELRDLASAFPKALGVFAELELNPTQEEGVSSAVVLYEDSKGLYQYKESATTRATISKIPFSTK